MNRTVKRADRTAADRILAAACRETVRQIRAGETTYVVELVAATRAANLLIGGER